MDSIFPSVTLGENALKIGSGATPRGGEKVYIDSGVALIRSQNVYNNWFEFHGLAYISDAHAEALANVKVEPGDVLLNITGDSVARVCQVPAEVLPARVNQHVAIIRPDPNQIDATFLRYFLVSPQMQAHMLMLASAGATRNALTKGMIEQFQIPNPPLAEQRAIARILGTLDDKIELNRQMNQTLEEMARAIFKSWFVDFDPVHAKARGEQPVGMDADTAALFPDSFDETELGHVPSGWKVGVIGGIAENLRRSTNPSDISPSTPYIGLGNMPQRSIALADWDVSDSVASGKFQFKTGEVLFGKLRPYFHKVGIAPLDGVCSTDILVVAANDKPWFGLMLGHLTSDVFIEYATAVSTGTRMPRTNWKDMARYPIALPPISIAERFTSLIEPMLNQIRQNIHEARTLAELRDTLLPKLMSGELRVPEAVEMAEAIA